MDTQNKDQACCEPLNNFKIESVVRFDERGQFVLPKDLREKAGIQPGDKLAIISCGNGEEICCLTVMKSDELQGMLKDFLGPMFKEIAGDS